MEVRFHMLLYLLATDGQYKYDNISTICQFRQGHILVSISM